MSYKQISGQKSKRDGHAAAIALCALMAFVYACPQAGAQSSVSVLTRSYNNQRTGANIAETILNQSNVNTSQFGKLFALAVDDQVYAGVLYVSSAQIAGGIHNVLYVATVNNSVYAFDADTLGPPLWQKNFNGTGRPTSNTDFAAACPGGYFDFRGNIGIVGTPVIDGSSGTMYFVTRTVESAGTVQRLRAIDITTGNDRANSPKVITASIPGTGDGGSTDVFNPTTQNQRPALAFAQGTVYVAWASYCDITPYHGWVLAYDGMTLLQTGVFNDTVNGTQGGIWMAGAGIAFDANGNLFISTGNGTADGVQDFGESVVKLAPNTLSRLDYYTASNYNTLNSGDVDFGSGGPAMLPGVNLLVTGGKEGRLYLLNTNNLGQLVAGDVQIPQVFQAVDPTVRPAATHHIHASNPIWSSPQGLNIYVWGENDFLHGYRFNTGTNTIGTTPFASGSVLPPVGMPGGIMSLSGNGSQTGAGILWAASPRNGDANEYTVPGALYAFNAETLGLLWQSSGIGDDVLNMSKGSPPIVANGKAYVAGLSRFVSVFGLRSTLPPSQNLALNKTATGSTSCNSNETPDKAVNGSFSLGLTDKWCSLAASPFLQVDFGSAMSVNRFVVGHAGSGGGESFNLNTSAFNIQVSVDNITFTTVASVSGNVDSITTHDITPAIARYVKLNIITPTQPGNDSAARIYEFQVYRSPDFTVSAAPGLSTVNAGGSATVTVSQSALGLFNGSVAYAVSGLPAGATASFSPSSIGGTGTSILNIATTSASPAGTYALALTGTSATLQHTTSVTLAIVKSAVDFALAATPATQTLTAGNAATYTASVAALNGFVGSVAVAATGLPSGATASFNPSSIATPGTSSLSISTTAATAAGTYTITVTGASGALQHSATVSLTVNPVASAPSPVPVSLTAAFNKIGSVTDGSSFTTGLDGYGFAYSANLLSAAQVLNGTPFNLGSAGVANVVSNATIALPAGQFAALKMLATGINGNQISQVFIVKYTDGSSSTFTQSLSDWYGPQSYVGETVALAMSYRDTYSGGRDSRIFNVYSYSFLLNQSKTVSSISLPANGNVAVVAITLSPAAPVSLSSLYNRYAFVTDGTVFANGGLDTYGFAYSANLIGTAPAVNGTVYSLGPTNALDAVAGAIIPLPAGHFSALNVLATAVNGSQLSQTFTAAYTDGTTTSFVQSVSDWFANAGFPGESAALTMAYRDAYNGTKDSRTFWLYGYLFPLNVAKTLRSITLPANSNVVILALTAIP